LRPVDRAFMRGLYSGEPEVHKGKCAGTTVIS
jgi:hypothetical protein